MTPFVLDVVDGVRVSEHSGDLLHRPPTEWNGHLLPCQTCDGDGEFFTDLLGHVHDCPDCVDGHPIIEHEMIEPHCYTEKAARARLSRRRRHGEDDLFMREIDGKWYTGRSVRVSVQAVPIVDKCSDRTTHLCKPGGAPNLTWYLHLPLTDDAGQTEWLVMTPDDAARPGQFAIIATPERDDQ